MNDTLSLRRYARPFALAAMLLTVAWALVACGGGQVAGVGSGGSGVAGVVDGTVSGFGSVLVDGTEYDDSSAAVQQDDGSGALENADLKIGQRVRLQLDSSGKVLTATVLAQLVGPVTATQDANGNLQVLGQLVRLSGSAADTAHGAAMAMAGFTAASAAAGDEVEVHGTWIYDSTAAAYVLLANRLEKLAVSADPVVLSGVVQSAGSGVLQLNSATGLTVTTATLPATVGAGSLVRVWATRAAWMAHTANPTGALPASRVVDMTLKAGDLADQALTLAGPVGRYDPATRTVEIQGTRVALPSGVQLDPAQLVPGQFLSLQVQRVGASLVASVAKPRGSAGSANDLGQSIVLKAIASGIDWSAGTVRFALRGVAVEVPPGVVRTGCTGMAGMNRDLLVLVIGHANPGSDVVTATAIVCSTPAAVPDPMAPVIADRLGTVTQLNLATSTFVLHTAQGDVTVQWDAQTFFPNEFNKHPERLSGQSVAVEGVVLTGILRARKVTRSG